MQIILEELVAPPVVLTILRCEVIKLVKHVIKHPNMWGKNIFSSGVE